MQSLSLSKRKTFSFFLSLFLLSLQLMKVLAESSCVISFLRTLYALSQSVDMSQVGVAPFYPIKPLFLLNCTL